MATPPSLRSWLMSKRLSPADMVKIFQVWLGELIMWPGNNAAVSRMTLRSPQLHSRPKQLHWGCLLSSSASSSLSTCESAQGQRGTKAKPSHAFNLSIYRQNQMLSNRTLSAPGQSLSMQFLSRHWDWQCNCDLHAIPNMLVEA